MTTAMDAAVSEIEAAGWSIKRGPAAEKFYDSAVGPKKALIWVSRKADQVGNFTISGEFWSEGRNVAENQGLVLNALAPAEDIPRLISSFLSGLERAIRDSYAVRLLETQKIEI